eukprot:gene5507-11100_t
MSSMATSLENVIIDYDLPIPPTHNYFGGLRVNKVLVDMGRFTILLPLEKGQLCEIFEKFPSNNYILTIGGGVGTAPFTIELCQDIITDTGHDTIDNDNNDHGSHSRNNSIQIKRLRFSLSSDDITEILDTPSFHSRFTPLEVQKLSSDLKSYPHRKRRTHAAGTVCAASSTFHKYDLGGYSERYVAIDAASNSSGMI